VPRNKRMDALQATARRGVPGVLTKEKSEREPESASTSANARWRRRVDPREEGEQGEDAPDCNRVQA
jgi:hypothetical protein